MAGVSNGDRVIPSVERVAPDVQGTSTTTRPSATPASTSSTARRGTTSSRNNSPATLLHPRHGPQRQRVEGGARRDPAAPPFSHPGRREVHLDRTDVATVSKWLSANGWTVITSEIGYLPKSFADLTEVKQAEAALTFGSPLACRS
jgi:hypothetical protein